MIGTKNKPVIRKIIRILAWILIIFLILLIVLKVIFDLNKENIKDYIVSTINQNLAGEVAAKSITFSPLYHFPYLSLGLNEVEIYESRTSGRQSNETAFCKLNKLYIGLNVISLIRGDLHVAELSAENGELNIIVRKDSSVNILDLIPSGEDSTSREAYVDQETADLRLNKFSLNNIRLVYANQLSDHRLDIQIREFENLVTLVDRHLDIRLLPQIEIRQIKRGNYRFLENTRLDMSVNMKIDLDSMKGTIENSIVTIEGAQLKMQGGFDFKQKSFLDLQISSVLNDPSLLLLIFDEKAIEQNLKNIGRGNIYFDGRITGDISGQLPFIEINFGIKNVNLKVPETDREIRNLGFDGYFTTGRNPDHSDGILSLTNVTSDGPAGRSHAELYIRNFEQPDVNIDMDAIIDLTRIDRALRSLETPIYSGILRVKANVLANFDQNMNKIIRKEGNVDLNLQDCSFLIENTGQICEQLSGQFSWQENRIMIKSLNLAAPGNRFSLNGTISNIVDHLLGIDSDLEAKVKLEADSLDFKTFLTRDDAGQWILDEYCQNVSVDLNFMTNSRDLRQETELPVGTLIFDGLKIDLKNVSDVNIRGGEVQISPQGLDFRNMLADIAGNQVLFSAAIENYPDLFANEFQDSCRISLDLKSGQFRLKDFFTYKGVNHLPEHWAENTYDNLHLAAVLILPENADSMVQHPHAFNLQVHKLDGINTRSGTEIRGLRVDVRHSGEDLILSDLNGQIGQTKMENSAINLIGLFGDDRDVQIKLILDCDLLDVGEWLGFTFDRDSSESTDDTSRPISREQVDQITIPALDINAKIGKICYEQNFMQNLSASVVTRKANVLHLDPIDSTWWIPEIDLTAQIDTDTFKTDYFTVPQAHDSIVTRNNIIEIFPSHTGLFEAGGTGQLWIDLGRKRHQYHLRYTFNNHKIETLLNRFGQEQYMSGIIEMFLELKMDGEDLAKLDGAINLSGKDLTIYNIDIDEVLERFKRTQNFNLVDVGAFLLAGPAGALVTKASDYITLLNIDPTKQSKINDFMSSWKVADGRFMAEDVALTTAKSRIALKGGIDFNRQEFVDFTLAVVDKKGCPLISQTITGSIFSPKLQKINAVNTVLAPVTNVLKLITGTDCEPFYTGSVPHPEVN